MIKRQESASWGDDEVTTPQETEMAKTTPEVHEKEVDDSYLKQRNDDVMPSDDLQ